MHGKRFFLIYFHYSKAGFKPKSDESGLQDVLKGIRTGKGLRHLLLIFFSDCACVILTDCVFPPKNSPLDNNQHLAVISVSTPRSIHCNSRQRSVPLHTVRQVHNHLLIGCPSGKTAYAVPRKTPFSLQPSWESELLIILIITCY